MKSPSRLAGGVAAIAATTALAFPALAGAKAGDRTFQQTFPVASALCARVTAGTEGKHLRKFATRVLADCAQLQSTFTSAHNEILAARGMLEPQIAADRAAVTVACPTPTNQPPGCAKVEMIDDAAIAALHVQLHRDSRSYYAKIEAARRRFWKAIRALPGESRIHEDEPIPQLSS